MSTAPVDRATLPSVMGDGVTRPDRAFRLSGETFRRIAVELGDVPRYVVRYLVAVLVLLGLFSLWDAHGDSHVPALVPLMGTEKDPHLHSGLSCAEPGVRDRERWQALSAPLAILDDVNSQGAGWVREMHNRGGLVFSNRHTSGHDRQGSLANFDHISRKLTVQRALFEENDGEIAVILCHEYRHSRQNPAKLIRSVLSFVVTTEGDRSILENDAELYEHEARLAIFRK